MSEVKCVVLGDHSVGKSSLIGYGVHGASFDVYNPVYFDVFVSVILPAKPLFLFMALALFECVHSSFQSYLPCSSTLVFPDPQ